MTGSLEAAIRVLLKEVLVEVAREILPAQLPFRSEQSAANGSEDRMLLRSSEVAELLAISERQLHKIMRSGLLPCVRVGKLVRYRPDAIQDWIRQSESLDNPLRKSNSTRRHGQPRTKKTRPKAGRKSKTTKNSSTPAIARDQASSPPARVAAEPRTHRNIEGSSENRPRSVCSCFASRLGVAEDALPQMTNGDIMRVADIDIPTLHGWQYRNRDLPEAAISRLHEYFVAFLKGRE